MKTFIFAAIARSNMKQRRPAYVRTQASDREEARRILAPVYVIYGWMGQIVNCN
ncbi:host cell division inhibitor Icd-like protein [Xenorhabdus japonica]|uniref:Host cell division inhibitor Icd-like protein n=1 Tax=Xenorhabdus japonica TaxID=53341 RepID=A0A1I5EF83_9GAMM|nr:hypothetical protein SAMN05421579_16712 [Xenorhabdus japonica]